VPLPNTMLLGTTRVSLPKGISYCPAVLVRITNVTDRRYTLVAMSQIAIVMLRNTGHNSADIEDTQMLKKSPFRTQDFHLTPSLQGVRVNIRTNLILLETRLSTEHFCC